MASSKPKIQGYIEQATFNRFEAYRQESNLSQSQALEKILIKFLGGDRISEIQEQDYSLKMDLQYAITEIEKLQERVRRLEITSNLDGESLGITGNLDSESLGITGNLDSESLGITGNLESESLGITGNLDSESLGITGNLDSDSLSKLSEGLSQRALAKRLKCSHTLIGKFQKIGQLNSYSKEHDPVGIAWEFRDGKYYPALQVNSDRQSAIK